MAKKRKASTDLPPHCAEFTIHGIWDSNKKQIIFISLNEDDADLEYEMEQYSEPYYKIVSMKTIYDISNLEQ
jgi:hypothetical protein